MLKICSAKSGVLNFRCHPVLLNPNVVEWMFRNSRAFKTLINVAITFDLQLANHMKIIVKLKSFFLQYGMFVVCDVRDVGFLGYGMFRLWDVWGVECLGCWMFRMWDLWDVGCSGRGMPGIWMFRTWDVQDLGCSDVRCMGG